MKPSFIKVGISITLCTGLVVPGVGPIQSEIVSAAASSGWLDSSPITMPSIDEDDYLNSGVLVSNLLSGKVSNPEFYGIAVVGIDNASGAWQYYNTDARIWYNIEPVSDNSAFLLQNTMRIRFVPAQDWNGTTPIHFKLWDTRSAGYYNYQKSVNTTVSSAFSVDSRMATITVTPVNDAPYLTEMNGGDYLNFDGNGDYVAFPDLGIYGDSFTVEGNLKVNAFKTWMRFFDSSIGMQNYNVFVGFNGTKMNFSAYTYNGPVGSGGDINVTENFPINKWVHVAIVYDQSQKKGRIYWDGILKAEGKMDLSIIGNKPRPNNWLGKSTWQQDGDYTGGMRDVRFWSKAKSQSEIAGEMNVDLTGSEDKLVVNYKLGNSNDGNKAVSTPTNSKLDGQIKDASWAQDTGFTSNTTLNKNTSATRSFKVSDLDGDTLQVTAVSSNPAVVPNEGLQLSGSGEERTLSIVPAANAYGTSVISVTVDDGTLRNTYTFIVTVNDVGGVIVTGVTLDQGTLSLTAGGAGETLNATVKPANATNKDVIWSTSDETVATVVNGVVTPVGVGTATITVTTTDGSYTATTTVHVAAPIVIVTGVTLDQGTLSLTAGGAGETLNATVEPANATNKGVIWSTSDETVATVVNGVVTPVGVGTATITVTTTDGSHKATTIVSVVAPIVNVTGVTLDQGTLSLTAGGAGETLNATVEPANATNKDVIWSTSDETVATVVNGVVTPVGVGTATITVTTTDGSHTATTIVSVVAPIVNVTGVKLDQGTLSLTAGGAGETLNATVEPANATNKGVIWSTSDETVATVVNGVVTPVGVGTAIITVTTTDGSHTATTIVSVVAPPTPTPTPTPTPSVNVTGVTLDQGTLNLTAGEAGETLNVTVEPANATNKDVIWTSSDETVATVVNGVVTPVGVGTAIITVTTTDGSHSATSTVHVATPPTPSVNVTGVTLDQGTLNLTAGEAGETLNVTVEPANATNKGVIWSSSDETVATVVYGVVTPIGVGTAIITVTTKDGSYSAMTTVNVAAPSKPIAAPNAPTSVKAIAENGQAIISFTAPENDGGSDVTSYLVTANPGGITAIGTGSPITITGLTNGTSYSFTVQAINKAGTSVSSLESNVVIPKSPSSGDIYVPSQPIPSTTPAPAVIEALILINGKTETVGTSTTGTRNDQTVTTIALDQKKLEDKLATEGQNTVVSISVNSKSDVVVGELNGQMVKDMQEKQAVLEIKTESATFTLPAQQINIKALSEQFGKSVTLQDIKLQIEIAVPTADTMKAVEGAALKGSFTVVSPPINFIARGLYDNTSIELTDFNDYVERTIAIPEGMDPNKITTGVFIDSDGAVHHVPTKVVVINGKYFAKINSLTSGTYSVIWHPLEFSDVANHWAKKAVNDMGSRLVIEGTESGMFSPDRDITRAEFAAIVVRGLGLGLDQSATPFSDVTALDWYSGAINTAYAYQLINGFEDGTFRANDQITREQAMTIIAKAMKITKLNIQSTDAMLRPYNDALAASNWAITSITDCLQAGIIMGRTSAELAPKDYMTRAEVAAIVERLLQKSDLI